MLQISYCADRDSDEELTSLLLGQTFVGEMVAVTRRELFKFVSVFEFPSAKVRFFCSF